MRYLYALAFSAVLAIAAPLGLAAVVMDTEPAIIPNMGYPAFAQLSPAEAVEYLKDPSNYEELVGLRKYVHFTYIDNEYRLHTVAFPFLCALTSVLFGLWLGSSRART